MGSVNDAQSVDPMGQLCAVLRSGEDSIRGAAFGRMEDLEPLIRAGILVEHGTVSSIRCDACDEGHLAQVESHPLTGGPCWRCPDVGYVKVDADDIRAYVVRLPSLIAQLGSAFAVHRRHRGEIIAELLWRIGPAKTEIKTADVWFLRQGPMPCPAIDLSDHLKLSPKCEVGLLLHARGTGAAVGTLPSQFLALSLEELVTVDDGGRFSADADALDRAIEMALPDPVPSKPGRPSGIERTRAVMEWLQSQDQLPVGRNAAAKAVRENWSNAIPDREPPAESTVKGHVTKIGRSR